MRAAGYMLLGLRYDKEMSRGLFKGVRNMRESTFYQVILEEGEAIGEAKGEAKGEAGGGSPCCARRSAASANAGSARCRPTPPWNPSPTPSG